MIMSRLSRVICLMRQSSSNFLPNEIRMNLIVFYSNDSRMTTIRAAQNTTKPEYISRVVLDMEKMDEFSLKLSDDKKTLTILFGAVTAFIDETDRALNTKIIVLDPGHGGKDPGAVISDLIEKELNLDIAKRVQALLKKDRRFEVHMTREDDTFVELVKFLICLLFSFIPLFNILICFLVNSNFLSRYSYKGLYPFIFSFATSS